MLATGRRTVTAALRVMGFSAAKDFARYHYVLNHARWNSRAVARKLLLMIVNRFAPSGPIVIGLDDTIERGWGRKIAARNLPRPRALVAEPFRQDQRLALAFGDGDGSRTLGAAAVCRS